MTKTSMAKIGLTATAVVLAAFAAWWSFQHATARHHWQAAQLALEEQDTDRALVHLSHCLAWWDTHPEVRLLASQAARLAGNYDDAEAHLAWCEQRQSLPDDARRRERALLQVQQGDFKGHLEFLTPRGPDDPNLPVSVLEAFACGLDRTSYFDTAMVYLQRIVQQEPKHARAHLLAGGILLRKRYADQALPHFQAALEQIPGSLAPRLKLAECLLELGETREAAAHIEALRNRHPNAPDLLLVQARLAQYRARPEEAKVVVRRLLALDPDHVEALVTLGRLEFRHGEAKAALEPLNKAASLHPSKLETWELLAHCHAAEGNRIEEARCHAEHVRIGRESGEATRLTLQVMLEKADDLALRIELAERYERLNDLAKALQWRICTLHLDPAHSTTHRALAELLDRAGQPHRAARHRTLARG